MKKAICPAEASKAFHVQSLLPTSNDEVVLAVSNQDWLDQVSSLYSADLLAAGSRVRGVLELAGAQWVVTGGSGLYHSVSEVRAVMVVPRAVYTGPIWTRCKDRRDYAEPREFYTGRVVSWKKQEWVLVQCFLRLIKIDAPVSNRQRVPRRKRKATPYAVQSSFS